MCDDVHKVMRQDKGNTLTADAKFFLDTKKA